MVDLNIVSLQSNISKDKDSVWQKCNMIEWIVSGSGIDINAR